MPVCRTPDPAYRRARHADLPDHLFVFDRCGSRGVAVRVAGFWQYLFAHHRIRPAPWLEQRVAALRRAVRRRLRWHPATRTEFLTLHCADGAGGRVSFAAKKALWRFDQPVHPFLQEFRLAGEMGPIRRGYPATFDAAVTDKTKAIFIESIANPGRPPTP